MRGRMGSNYLVFPNRQSSPDPLSNVDGANTPTIVRRRQSTMITIGPYHVMLSYIEKGYSAFAYSPSPSWTPRPRPTTGDSPPDLVRHHLLALSSLHIPAVIPFLNPLICDVNLPNMSSKWPMERSHSGFSAARNLPSRCPRSLRRRVLTVGWRSTLRGVTRSRRSRLR